MSKVSETPELDVVKRSKSHNIVVLQWQKEASDVFL